jgi:hypothetical protein
MRSISFGLILSLLISFFSPLAALAGSGQVHIAGWFDQNSLNTIGRNLFIQQAPNDPLYSSQWYLSRIKIPAAWNKTTGSSSTVVAVIDTGINLNHEDLQNKLWTGSNGAHGYNFIDNNTDLSDPNGHGTGAASLIAAATNNGVGIAGINWKASIMALKALNASGSGDYNTVARAIRYAADNGADIINMSFGTDIDSGVLRDAVDYANAKGVVMVAAAGNDHASSVYYPAAYPDVIAVGSTDQNDQKPNFSNYGSGLDLVAPGVSIIVADNRGASTYSSVSGTSFSAAEVSGVVSLIDSFHPLNYQSALSLLTSSADDLGNSFFFGSGMVDAGAAVNLASQASHTSAQISLSKSNIAANGVDAATVTVNLQNNSGTPVSQNLQLLVSGRNNIVNRHRLLVTSGMYDLGQTDSLGQLSFTLSSTESGQKTITIYLSGAQLAQASVIFTPVQPVLKAVLISQSSAPILHVGQEAMLQVQFKNTGNLAWLGDGADINGQIRLGTYRLADRASTMRDNEWVSANRAALISPDVVLPGEIGSFNFSVQPSQVGVFYEYFRPVAEYVSWFGPSIRFKITVQSSLYNATLVAQGEIVTGNQITLWADFRNIGTATWRGGNGAVTGQVRLGTDNPNDHPSALFDPSWISNNRATNLSVDVTPGNIGRFTFKINPAALPVRETFKLVAEYVTWFGDSVTFNLS